MSEPEDDDRSSSSSEEEDEDAKGVTEEIEKNFLRTLSCLRKKDPKIYDSNVKFFNDEPSEANKESETGKKDKKKSKKESMSVRQYETKLLLEHGPEFVEKDEDEADIQEPSSPTYIEEQKVLKENFKKILDASDSEDDSEGLFKVKEKHKEEKEREEEAFRKWLKGQKEDIEDNETKKDLQYLHDCWTDPNIDKSEEFLKDYILNKRYLEKDDQSNKTELEDLSEEEEELKKAEEFEYKYNFRYEEPDREFLKRYPRDIESSMRRKKDKQEKRRLQREKAKERKLKKFEEKQKEVAELKKKKREELVEQIKKLKDLTGNDKLAFEDELMDEDFDSTKFDQKMEEVFNNDFYNDEDTEKPVFEDDDFDYSYYENQEADPEDPNFVMDCDYNPEVAKQKKLEKKLKSKDKKKNALTSTESTELPDEIKSNAEAFEKYIDEFYKYDFEDLIDDLPCRFKYSKVVPNSYGLTIDEILAADDDELEKWCSIKKVDRIRSEHAEKNEAKIYAAKARDEALKRKILPSLYKYKEAEEFDTKPEDEKKKKKKKKKKKSENSTPVTNHASDGDSMAIENTSIKEEIVNSMENSHVGELVNSASKVGIEEAGNSKKKKKKKNMEDETTSQVAKLNVEATNIKQEEDSFIGEELENSTVGNLENSHSNTEIKESCESKKKKKKRKRLEDSVSEEVVINEAVADTSLSPKKKKKRNSETGNDADESVVISNPNAPMKQKKKQVKTESKMNSNSVPARNDHNSPNKNKNRFSKASSRNSSEFKFKKNNNFNSFGKNRKNDHGGKFTSDNDKFSNSKFKNHNKLKSGKNIKPWQKSKIESNDKLGLSDARLEAYGINPKKFKNKLIYGPKNV
nr:PREDICTED: protein KRI1 homolog [Bemisia tabaci]